VPEAPPAFPAWQAKGTGLEAAAGAGPAHEEEEEDDVSAQKRAAQAAEAVAAARAKAAVDAALARLRGALGPVPPRGAPGGLAGAALALGELAQELLEAPVHALSALLRGGGLADVGSAVDAAGAAGRASGALPALLQSSWVLLHTAHGAREGRAALATPAGARALSNLLSAAVEIATAQDGDEAAAEGEARTPRSDASAACAAGDACAAVLRNASLVALLMVDQPGCAADAAAAGDALSAAGALGLLARVAAFEGAGGAAPAALAAGALSALVAAGGGAQAAAAAAAAAADALLQPAALRGLVFLNGMAHPPPAGAQQQEWSPQAAGALRALPGGARALALAAGALPRLLAERPEQLLRGLIEERLVGLALAAAPRRLGQLLVAHLVSSRGQAALAAVDAEWAADAPLALAQALASPLHLTLPAAAAAGGASALLGRGAGPADDVHTDVLAARLLLQGSRLAELVGALGEEAEEAAAAAAAGAAAAPPPPAGDATRAVLALAAHLLGRETELAAVRLVRGDSVADSSSEGSACCASLSTSSSRGAGGSACSAGDAGVEGATPWLGPSGRVRRTGAGPVAFAFGPHEHRVSLGAYRRLRRASKLLHSVLLRAEAQAGEPITVLCVPAFSDAANWWALTRLQQWADAAAAAAGAAGDATVLAGLDARQAALLWVAADFWQVDELQAACEDRLVAAIADAQAAGTCAAAPEGATAPSPSSPPQLLSMALALCARHAASSGRLRRLLARAFLRAAAAPGCAAPEVAAVVAQHRDVLLPAVADDLRDRLAALCVLNAGRGDADAPELPVGA
jgi:hypothetical protein